MLDIHNSPTLHPLFQELQSHTPIFVHMSLIDATYSPQICRNSLRTMTLIKPYFPKNNKFLHFFSVIMCANASAAQKNYYMPFSDIYFGREHPKTPMGDVKTFFETSQSSISCCVKTNASIK